MRRAQQKARHSTLKDVALEAGVSMMAVSKALNNKGGVSSETQKKIEAAAKKLNYTPNLVAKSLRSAKGYTIGVVMSDSSQYVFSKLLQGIESAASEAGYSVLLANSWQTDDKSEHKAIELLVSKRIDGLILAAPVGSATKDIERLKSLGIPFVLLMRTPTLSGADYVSNDNMIGGYESVKYLCETGDKKLFFIALDSSSGHERISGYKKYISEKGQDFGGYYIDAVRPTIEAGYGAMNKILARGVTEGDICCGCDLIAIGAMNAILDNNLAIPRDFRLLGYDDFELTKYLRVPLSTVRQPIFSIGVEGVNLLLKRMENPSLPFQSVILQPELVLRESTKLPPPVRAVSEYQ